MDGLIAQKAPPEDYPAAPDAYLKDLSHRKRQRFFPTPVDLVDIGWPLRSPADACATKPSKCGQAAICACTSAIRAKRTDADASARGRKS